MTIGRTLNRRSTLATCVQTDSWQNTCQSRKRLKGGTTNGQTGMQMDNRQKSRQVHEHTDGQTNRQIDRWAGRHADSQPVKQTGRHRES